jgi:hypothetical protein
LRELEEAINDAENWEETKREDGWEDRRTEPIIISDIDGKKVEISRETFERLIIEEECKKVMEEVKRNDKK